MVAFGRRAGFDLAYEHALPWLYGIAGNLLHSNRRRLNRDIALLARHPQARRSCRSRTGSTPRSMPAASYAHSSAGCGDCRGPISTRCCSTRGKTSAISEIAEALQIPVGTVRSRLNRLRRKLREPESDELTRTGRQQTEPGQGDGHG